MIAASASVAFRAQLVVPEQRQLYDYWGEKAAGRMMPDRRDISPAHFARLLPSVSLIDVDPLNGGCRFRLAGTRLRDIYDREVTGLRLDELDLGNQRDYWLAAFERTIVEGKPSQGVVRGPRVNKEHLVQYWLRLPLSCHGRSGVGMILCLDHLQSASEDEALETRTAV